MLAAQNASRRPTDRFDLQSILIGISKSDPTLQLSTKQNDNLDFKSHRNTKIEKTAKSNKVQEKEKLLSSVMLCASSEKSFPRMTDHVFNDFKPTGGNLANVLRLQFQQRRSRTRFTAGKAMGY